MPKNKDKDEFKAPRNISNIRNKLIRQEKGIELKKEKNKAKKALKKLREKDDTYVKQIPRTIENTRVKDDNIIDLNDDEVLLNQQLDEMASYYNRDLTPKILITTGDNPHSKTILFGRELKQTIPNSDLKWRKHSSLKKVVVQASERGYTDMLVIKEDRRVPSGILHVHLPNGPTAYYRVSNYEPCARLKHAAEYSSHKPEVIIQNFTTQLGFRLSRMLGSLFDFDPQFIGRRVVTFRNQRDYIFVRHHRYEFKEEGQRAALQEIGPRFTLRLQYLQKGTFDTKFGEYEWVPKQDEKRTNRRKFVL